MIHDSDSENPDEIKIHDAVKGRTLRYRGTVPGGKTLMIRAYEESNRRAVEGGYAR